MKFDWRLEHHENMHRWYEYRSTTNYRSRYCDLSLAEKAWLESLNQRLINIERRITPNLLAKYAELKRRVADPGDWLVSFNIVITTTYYLHEEDPEWEEDCENILTQTIATFPLLEDCGFGCLHVNHMEPLSEFEGQNHCWSYHELYDHSYLDWLDLFRIKSIWIDVAVEEQMFETLD